MYFFSLKPLKNDLAGIGLAEKDRFQYLLGWMFAGGLGLYGAREGGTTETVTATLMMLISLFGLWLAWKRNGRTEGRNFLDRFLSIGWVITFRTTVFFGLAAGIFTAILDVTGFMDLFEQYLPYISLLAQVALSSYIMLSIAGHTGEVRRMADQSSSEATPAQTAERLEKFVETVVRREMASAVVAKPRKPARKSTVKPLRSARTKKK